MPRVVKFNEIGGPDVLKLVDEPIAEPEKGEVRLNIHAIGLNRSELMFRQGAYVRQPEFPSRIGYEASGVITAVGEGVDGWSIGDRVGTIPLFSMSSNGVWAESAVVPAYAIVASPENLDDVEAAAIWISYTTAWGALVDVGSVAEGDFVLITAAASSVGLSAIQIARRAGAMPIATTRTSSKRDMLLSHGATHVIATNEESVDERVKQITDGLGARIVIDAVAGPIVEALAAAAAPNGIIIIYGMLASDPTPFPLYQALGKSLSIRGYTLSEILSNPDRWSRAEKDLRAGFEDGTLSPTIGERYTFDEIIDAQRFMEANKNIGKIVAVVKEKGK